MGRRVPPGRLRLIFRSKRTDGRFDAHKLAKPLLPDEVSPVHVPSADTRAWPAPVEHRLMRVADRTLRHRQRSRVSIDFR